MKQKSAYFLSYNGLSDNITNFGTANKIIPKEYKIYNR
jgi:hypothetical protein